MQIQVRRVFRSAIWIVMAVCAATAGASTAPWATADIAAVRENLSQLLGHEMRTPGSAANLALEQRVADVFAATGLEHGRIKFTAPTFLPGRARLLADGREFEILPLHPGLFRPGNFNSPAFDAEIVDLGFGAPADLKAVRGIDLDGKVALMDFHCGKAWERLLRFGIKGFIFVGSDRYEPLDAYNKVPTSEVAVPRYFVSAADGAAVRRAMHGRRLQASIEAEPSRWENRELSNPWVLIPGTDPELQGEVVVFTAPLDSSGVVPELTFGAEAGANLYTLLELLDEFSVNRPPRTVLLAAVNARTQYHLGDRVLAWYLMAPEGNVEEVRNTLSADLRLQELLVGYYEKLKFEPDTRQQDEEFLVELRTLSDDSIGRIVTIKDPLVALSKRDVNEIKGQRLRLYRETQLLNIELDALRSQLVEQPDADGLVADPQAEIERLDNLRVDLERQDDSLADNLQQYVNVLTLFNRVGIRTRLSDLNATEEAILRGYVDTLLERNRIWARKNRADLERSERNSLIRNSLGGRRIAAAISLEMNWSSPLVAFSSGIWLGGNPWADRWGRNTMRLAEDMAVGDGLVRRRNLLVDSLTSLGGLPEVFYVPLFSESPWFLQRAQRRPAFALNTAFAVEGRAFTPADTIENLDPGNIAEVAAFARAFFSRVLADAVITGTTELGLPNTGGQTLWSPLIKAYKFDEFAAGVLPEIPVPNSVIILAPPSMPSSGFYGPGITAAYMVLTDERAAGLFYGLFQTLLCSSAFAFDSDFVSVNHALDAGETHQKSNSDITRAAMRILSLTEVREFVVRDRVDPSQIGSSDIYVDRYLPLSAIRNSEPRRYGISGAQSVLSTKRMPLNAWGPAGIYMQPGESLKLLTNAKRAIINASEPHPEGLGFLDAGEMGNDFFRQAVEDMAVLNRFRFEGFHGIADELVSEFIDRGRRAAEESRTAGLEHDHIGYLHSLYEALGAQVKAYSQIASITNDMLKAVVFYMALLLPFCFFVQKLLFNAVRIERQMALFAVMFVACYILFRLIHPAFRVAQAPEAMFIAFVMGGLGMFVIYILHGRFEGEMQLLFSTMTGQEDSGVGYSMVSQQAMLIGVSNMKRRRIRTVLTTATIILVTFTMLAFTSVSRRMSPTMIRQDVPERYTGIMYHWPGDQRMDEATLDSMEQFFAGRADTYVRRWMLPAVARWGGQASSLRVETPDGQNAMIEGLLGIDPAEQDLLGPLPLIAGESFSAPDAYEVVIASSLAEVLNLDPALTEEQRIIFQNRKLRVVGIVDDERLRDIEDINGMSILPIKQILAPTGAGGGVQEDGHAFSEEASVFYASTAALLIVPVEIARRLGAQPYSISARFEDQSLIWPVVDQLLIATGARFFISSLVPFRIGGEEGRLNEPGVYYMGAGYRTSIGGLAMLIIPLLIASTIILNTMLGSVFERKKEIAVFNAVGLNPSHIGLFFLAESFVYGIIGAVGGYLIGQVLSIVLNHYGWVEDINLNFSSLSVAYVIVFTISIVLLSTLYPALVATKAAVPSGKRKWSMPPNDGNRMEVVFPFIYQPNIAIGLMGYLHDYFSQFSEASTGDLIAELQSRTTEKDAEGRPVYLLVYQIALAPFDLGVTQTVDFKVAFDAQVDAYRIVMTITRNSGQDTNWTTTNKPFLERLRRMLLQWRNMKPAEHGAYVRSATALFAEEPHGQ